MTDLARLQQWFFQVVTRGDRKGCPPLEEWIDGDAAHARLRMNVYREGYFTRLFDVLSEDYARIAKLVSFHDLSVDYLERHLSTHPSLRYIGERLPAFLAEHALKDEFPFICDLARLEWARVEVFDAADFVPMTTADLANVPADAWADLRLTLGPSFKMLDLAWPVHDAWLALDRDEPVPAMEKQATTLLVWRRDYVVYHRPAATEEERQALRLVLEGASFANVCEAFATVDVDRAAQKAFAVLQQWIVDGLVVAH